MDGQISIFDYMPEISDFNPLDALLDIAGPYFYGGEGYIRELVEKRGAGPAEIARVARRSYCPYGGCAYSRKTGKPGEIESYRMSRSAIDMAWISPSGEWRHGTFSWDDLAEIIFLRIKEDRYGKALAFSGSLLGGGA